MGALLNRVHLIAPRLAGQLVAQEVRIAGATDVSIHLQDLEQLTLRPLTGPGLVGDPLFIDDSVAGRAFSTEETSKNRCPTVRSGCTCRSWTGPTEWACSGSLSLG